MQLIVFYTTLPDYQTAEQLIATLINEKLIACANFHAIESCYTWQETLSKDTEIAVKLKTAPHLIELCQCRIAALHVYDTPCIYYSKVISSIKYMNWVLEQVR